MRGEPPPPPDVAARVAEVREPDLGAVEQDGVDGRAHSLDGGIFLDQLREPVVGAMHCSGQGLEEVAVDGRVEPPHRLHRDR